VDDGDAVPALVPVPLRGHAEEAGEAVGVVPGGRDDLTQLGVGPDVGQPLDAVGVRVERGDEHALRSRERLEQRLGGLDGRRDERALAGARRGGRVGGQQQRVVVEHLLEVRARASVRRSSSARTHRRAGR
jgi:hypothetical protein